MDETYVQVTRLGRSTSYGDLEAEGVATRLGFEVRWRAWQTDPALPWEVETTGWARGDEDEAAGYEIVVGASFRRFVRHVRRELARATGHQRGWWVRAG